MHWMVLFRGSFFEAGWVCKKLNDKVLWGRRKRASLRATEEQRWGDVNAGTWARHLTQLFHWHTGLSWAYLSCLRLAHPHGRPFWIVLALIAKVSLPSQSGTFTGCLCCKLHQPMFKSSFLTLSLFSFTTRSPQTFCEVSRFAGCLCS